MKGSLETQYLRVKTFWMNYENDQLYAVAVLRKVEV